MSEKLPLYVHAYHEKKPLTELFFWDDLHSTIYLLIVLADNKSSSLPMAWISEDGLNIIQAPMTTNILATLAKEEDISPEAMRVIEEFRNQ